MEYTKSIGDYYESFEGTPEEIAELIMRTPEKLEVGETVDEDELIEFIYNRLFPYNIPKDTIRQVLDAEIEYLQMEGIAE